MSFAKICIGGFALVMGLYIFLAAVSDERCFKAGLDAGLRVQICN